MDLSTKLKNQKGFICFFDIMGYQQLLENNSPENVAEHALSVLLNIHKDMPLKLLNIITEHFKVIPKETANEICKRIKWLVISDSILMTLDFDPVEKRVEDEGGFLLFCLQCSILWKSLFEYGLPTRGAISFGEYLIDQYCFAGRPIVEAYKTASDLNCSGVVLSKSGEEIYKKIVSEDGIIFTKYSIPVTSGGMHEKYVLNLMMSGLVGKNKWEGDLAQMVCESFWAHNKSAGVGVPEKMENSVRLLRFLKMKYPFCFTSTGHSPNK